MWGLGPVLLLPTASDEVLGLEKWGAGISGVVIVQPGNWALGALANNVWSFAGDSDRRDVNQFLFQYFLVRNLPDQWYLVSSPIITANWEADSGDQWTVPLGAGFGKLVMLGKLPVNLQVQGFYNVEKPEWAADWNLRLQVQFLFPKF